MTIPGPLPVAPTEVMGRFEIGETDYMLDRLTELLVRHGDTYQVITRNRGAPLLMIHAAEDVRRVLATNRSNYVKGLGFDRVRILFGDGLITSDGELWARQRAMMQPMFHRRVLAHFASSIAASNDALLARWEASVDQGLPVNVTEGMSTMMLDIVLRSIFGRDLERLVAETGSNPFDLVAQDSAHDLRFAYRFRSLGRLVAGLIERRRRDTEEHHDFVTMLMAARDGGTGAPMSERELIDEIMTLIVAGHETTATGLDWTWYLLSQHPEIEARCTPIVDPGSSPRATPPASTKGQAL